MVIMKEKVGNFDARTFPTFLLFFFLQKWAFRHGFEEERDFFG
jgi:hypothetical protein